MFLSQFNDLIIKSEESKELDNRAFSTNKIEPVILMEEASSAILNQLIDDFLDLASYKIAIVSGPGNNGADGLSLARKLFLIKNIKVDIFIFNSDKYSNLFNLQKNILDTLNFSFFQIEKLKEKISQYTIVIDSIFGIGYKDRLDKNIFELFSLINSSSAKIISIDVASGLNNKNLPMINPDITYSIGFYKQEFFNINTRKNCGILKNLKISFNINNINHNENYYIDILKTDFNQIFNNQETTHKNNFVNKYSRGASLFIGGSPGKSGSIIFAGTSALRTGCGISAIITEKENISVINSLTPELVVENFENIEIIIDKYNTIAIGPGLEISENSKKIIEEIIEKDKQFILDASFFNHFNPAILNKFKRSPILTPHTGEFKNFFKEYKNEINEHTIDTVREISSKYNCYLILKDTDIIIGTPDKKIFVIDNPVRIAAQAGSGDIITGIITGLLSQNHDVLYSILQSLKIFYTIADYYSKNSYISYNTSDFINKINLEQFNE